MHVMTITEIKHTKLVRQNMESIDIDMELFNQFYDPGMEPLTKEEWIDILERFDESYIMDQPCKMDNIIVGRLDEPKPPCGDLFTREEWSDILERFGTIDE